MEQERQQLFLLETYSLLTAEANGTVKVKATANDGSGIVGINE